MEVNQGFGTQKKCPFPLNRDNKYKDYVNIFPGPNLASPEWSLRCLFNRGVSKVRFHCSVRRSFFEGGALSRKYLPFLF